VRSEESKLVTVRYSDGTTEFRMSERSPDVGDILRRDGDNWVVEEVEETDDGSTVVTLRPRPFVEPPPEDETPGAA
jgi:hypothetical protein